MTVLLRHLKKNFLKCSVTSLQIRLHHLHSALVKATESFAEVVWQPCMLSEEHICQRYEFCQKEIALSSSFMRTAW